MKKWTYSDEKMQVEIGASGVSFVGVLDSTSFDKINTLKVGKFDVKIGFELGQR